VSTNLDSIAEFLKVIEQEFGLKWLQRKVKEGSSKHWVPGAWKEATTASHQAHTSKVLSLSPQAARLLELASALNLTRGLQGYSTAITADKLKASDFDSHAFVANVAAVGVLGGYEVEFLQVATKEGQKTADLRMRKGPHDLFVECKRKDPTTAATTPDPLFDRLRRSLESLHGLLKVHHEVIVVSIGSLVDSQVAPIVDLCRTVLGAGGVGIFPGTVPDCAVFIRRAAARPPGLPDGLWIPKWMNPGSVLADVKRLEDGKLQFGLTMRTTLYSIDSHRLGQILNSFGAARKQMPEGQSGLIYIEVDASKIRLGDQAFYFDLMAGWIRNQFSPTANRRVAAVVLTSALEVVTLTPKVEMARVVRVVRNRHAASQLQILLPGEPASRASG
jgi:hypothetical protein